jgi:hypothetical protein
MNYPRPETTPGVFLEHFDATAPSADGREVIVYQLVHRVAKEAARLAGWSFRSYSSVDTPGVMEDFVSRRIMSFPMVILFRDGIELGRAVCPPICDSAWVLEWGNKLLGVAGGKAADRKEIAMPPALSTKIHRQFPNDPQTMNDDTDPDLTALHEEIERHFASGTPLEIIYFGGGLPGKIRTITPLHYCEKRGRSHIIALCHGSGIEKTFRLDRMHLPGPPLAVGRNDFRIIAKCLGKPGFIEGMLVQIARLGNLPMEQALAAHFEQRGEFESFFDEYPYGGYTIELKITATVI